jgi:hypothetical protein
VWFRQADERTRQLVETIAKVASVGAVGTGMERHVSREGPIVADNVELIIRFIRWEVRTSP